MRKTELDGFDAATVLRAKTRIRRKMRKTKNSVCLKKYQMDWVLEYMDRLESMLEKKESGDG